jgi:hypothetical protein
MKAKRNTSLFVICFVVIGIAYDAYTILAHGVDSSISRLVNDWAGEYPIMTFSTGILCGHLFWPQPKPENKEGN